MTFYLSRIIESYGLFAFFFLVPRSFLPCTLVSTRFPCLLYFRISIASSVLDCRTGFTLLLNKDMDISLFAVLKLYLSGFSVDVFRCYALIFACLFFSYKFPLLLLLALAWKASKQYNFERRLSGRTRCVIMHTKIYWMILFREACLQKFYECQVRHDTKSPSA